MTTTGKIVTFFSFFLLTLGGTAIGANECDGEDTPTCYLELALAEFENGNLGRGLQLIEMSCEGTDNDDDICHFLAGMNLLARGNIEEAARFFEKLCNSSEHSPSQSPSCTALNAIEYREEIEEIMGRERP